MSRFKTFQISLPTDALGFVGRACDAPDCRQYFKILVPDHGQELNCPYCGTRFPKSSLATAEQVAYITEAAKEEARVYAINELQKTLKSALRGSKHITYRPGPKPTKRPVRPRYAEREVDTEFQCSECSVRFQVYGIFGYCPGCGCENLQIYDANWTKIKRGLAAETSDQNRRLRHAYSDLVSTFEVFCEGKARRLAAHRGNFQVLFDARKFFKDRANVDILKNVVGNERLVLRRVFQKRHVCIHAGGKITDRYVRMIPEDSALLGQAAPLAIDELEVAAKAMRVALGDLVKAVERPGA